MNKVGKRVLIGCLVVALVGGLAAGGVYLVKNQKKDPIGVFSIADVGMTEYWGDESQTYGSVSTDKMQNVYISTTQIIKEIYVQEGQEVKTGDPLLAYDTTLSSLALETKRLEIEKLKLSLEKAQKDLKKIQKYRAGVPVDEDDLVSGGSSGLGGLTKTSAKLGKGGIALVGKLDFGETAANGVKRMPAGSSVAHNGGLVLLGAVDPTVPMESTIESGSPEGSTDPSSSEGPTDPSSSEGPTDPSSPEESTDPSSPEGPTDPSSPEEPTDPSSPEDPNDPPVLVPVRGDGTKESPYLYLWKLDFSYTAEFITQVLNGRPEAVATFMLRENDSLEGACLSSWQIRFTDNKGAYSFAMLGVAGPETDPMATPVDPNNPDNPDIFDPGGDILGPSGPTYTASEIAKMKSDKEMEIRDINLNIRVAQVEYDKLEKELNDGVVYAEVDGVVKTVGDSETAAVDHKPLVTVSGGGGYYVQGTLSELELETVKVGQTVNVMSWMSGESAEGTIQEISDMPVLYGNNYGNGNTNVSYYPFTIFIDGESSSFEEGDYLDITYTPQTDESGSNSLYLQNMFVRSEDGQSYVYVAGKDGLLERREVVTGKSLYGSYTEIRSGLSADDKVAFPYGKEVKEGCPTEAGNLEEFYNSMYR